MNYVILHPKMGVSPLPHSTSFRNLLENRHETKRTLSLVGVNDLFALSDPLHASKPLTSVFNDFLRSQNFLRILSPGIEETFAR
jgi:hypothetical protein